MKHRASIFNGNYRIHIGLPVTNIEKSKQFYRLLLGVDPAKERPGYMKFEPADPSINLSLNQVERELPGNAESHFGIQVRSAQELVNFGQRLKQFGISATTQQEVVCCYAVQDKIWVEDPDGHKWEVFMVLDTEADLEGPGEDCCSARCCTDSVANRDCAVDHES